MQTSGECFKYVVFAADGPLLRRYTCLLGVVGGEGGGGGRHLSYTSFRRCHTTEAENHHANPVIWPWARGSGSLLSTNPPFMDICSTSCATGQALPSSAAQPRLILCVSERRVAVLPHRQPTDGRSILSHHKAITRVTRPGPLLPRSAGRWSAPGVCSGS